MVEEGKLDLAPVSALFSADKPSFLPPSGCLRARKSHDEEKKKDNYFYSFFTYFMHPR